MSPPTSPMIQLTLTVPPGARANQEMQFLTPNGTQMSVRIPPGVPPGASFVFEAPLEMAAPTGMPMGTAVADADAYAVPVASRQPAAKKFAECPICFEPLHASAVGVFLDASKRRASSHYFNLEAARQWLATGNGLCPLTRRPVASVLAVPDVRTDPDRWFDAVDVDGNGRLTRHEAIEALKAQFAVDVASLDAAVADPRHWMWERWDVNGDGTLTRDELLAPSGLVHAARELFAAPSTARNGSDPPPIGDKAAWYNYWDSPATGGDGSGTLEREEVVRALLKTLKLTSDARAVMEMRGTVDAIWGVFDTDGSGSVERSEFLQPDGLADTIIATLAH